MRRTIQVIAIVLAASAMILPFAVTASAYPTRTTLCSGCHSGVDVPVSATLLSTSGTSATYSFSAPAATAVAVFSGATKVATVIGVSGQFTVTAGSTYTVFAVKGPTTGSGIGSTSVSPPAPVIDATAPTTLSNAQTTYVGSASIILTAADNAGGTGVAHTYHILDGAPQAEGLTVAVSGVGSHTLEFWSVDVAGNIETHSVVTFTITAPQVIDATAPTTLSNAQTTYVGSASIILTAADNAGGTGVAHTYHILDGAPQAEGLTVAVSGVGSHTLEFWSVDVAGNMETHSVVTFTITAPPAADLRPVYRFFNLRSGVHFYTANEVEKTDILSKYSAVYRFEGVAYHVNVANPVNTAPLYRFYNLRSGVHFYTANEAEKDQVLSQYASVYRFEGVAFSVSAVPAALPVYRFYNLRSGVHFYTANEAEKDQVLALYGSVYRFEGIGFYVGQ